jgi:hypothetical protein
MFNDWFLGGFWHDFQNRLLLLRFWLLLKQKCTPKTIAYITLRHGLHPWLPIFGTYGTIRYWNFCVFLFFIWRDIQIRLLLLRFWFWLNQKCTPKTIACITLRHGLYPRLPIFGTYGTIWMFEFRCNILFFVWYSNTIIVVSLLVLVLANSKMHAKNICMHHITPRIVSVATNIWYLRHHSLLEFLCISFCCIWNDFHGQLLFLHFRLNQKKPKMSFPAFEF